MFWSFALLPLANAVAIQFATPLIVTALSVLLLDELVGKHRWAAILIGLGGDDELAQTLVWNGMAFAEGIKPVPAFDTEFGFQRALGIIETGVNDFAIAGAGLRADAGILLQDHDVALVYQERQRGGVREGGGGRHEGRQAEDPAEVLLQLLVERT